MSTDNTTKPKPEIKIKATESAAPAAPAKPKTPDARDPVCAKLGRHETNCSCTGELRAPMR